jgi:hypothetical protein
MRTRVDPAHLPVRHFGMLGRVVDGAPSRRPSTPCLDCGGLLELTSPGRPVGLDYVAACTACRSRFILIDATSDWSRYVVVDLPSRTFVRRQLGVED